MIARDVMTAELQRHAEAVEQAKALNGQQLLALARRAAATHGSDLRGPPFLVQFDERVVGLLDEHGDFAPFPYGYPLDSLIDRSCSRMYELKAAVGADIQLVPAVPGAEGPRIADGETFEDIVGDLPVELWPMLETQVREMGQALVEMSRPALMRVLADAYHGAYPRICQLRDMAQQNDHLSLGTLFTLTLLHRGALQPLVWQAYQDSVDRVMREIKGKANAGGTADHSGPSFKH